MRRPLSHAQTPSGTRRALVLPPANRVPSNASIWSRVSECFALETIRRSRSSHLGARVSCHSSVYIIGVAKPIINATMRPKIHVNVDHKALQRSPMRHHEACCLQCCEHVLSLSPPPRRRAALSRHATGTVRLPLEHSSLAGRVFPFPCWPPLWLRRVLRLVQDRVLPREGQAASSGTVRRLRRS